MLFRSLQTGLSRSLAFNPTAAAGNSLGFWLGLLLLVLAVLLLAVGAAWAAFFCQHSVPQMDEFDLEAAREQHEQHLQQAIKRRPLERIFFCCCRRTAEDPLEAYEKEYSLSKAAAFAPSGYHQQKQQKQPAKKAASLDSADSPRERPQHLVVLERPPTPRPESFRRNSAQAAHRLWLQQKFEKQFATELRASRDGHHVQLLVEEPELLECLSGGNYL